VLKLGAAALTEVAARVVPPPNNLFAPRPHGGVRIADRRSAGGVDGRPHVRDWIVATAVVQVAAIETAPNDHFISGPNGGMRTPEAGSVGKVIRNWSPGIEDGIEASTITEDGVSIPPAPNDHLAAAPDGGMPDPGSGRAVDGQGSPCIDGRIVTAAIIFAGGPILTAPDDHL